MVLWKQKNDVKKQECGFLGAVLATASLVQPVICSVKKGISSTGVRRAGRGYIIWIKFFSSAPSFTQYLDY